MSNLVNIVESEILRLKKQIGTDTSLTYKLVSERAGVNTTKLWRMCNNKTPMTLDVIQALEDASFINIVGNLTKIGGVK